VKLEQQRRRQLHHVIRHGKRLLAPEVPAGGRGSRVSTTSQIYAHWQGGQGKPTGRQRQAAAGVLDLEKLALVASNDG